MGHIKEVSFIAKADQGKLTKTNENRTILDGIWEEMS